MLTSLHAEKLSKKSLAIWLAITGIIAGGIVQATLPHLQDPLPPSLRLSLVVVWLCFLPGYLLDEILRISGDRLSLSSPVIWFALSCGITAPAGWVVLSFHSSIVPFGWIIIFVNLLLAAFFAFEKKSFRPFTIELTWTDRWIGLAFIVLALAVAGVAVIAPRSADDWSYGAFLRDYVSNERINLWHPLHGEGFSVTPRFQYNVWLVTLAYAAKTSGLDPAFQLLPAIRPALALLAIAAAYTLASSLFPSRRGALVATVIHIGTLLLSAGFRNPGWNLLATITDDKIVAAMILLPVGLALLMRHVERKDWPAWWGLGVLAAGLVAVHAQVYMLFLIACSLFWTGLFAMRYHRQHLIRLTLVILWLLPWAGFVVWTAMHYTRLGPMPNGPGWDLLAAADAAQGRILRIGDSLLFVVDPRQVFYPLLVISLAATPILLVRRAHAGLPSILLFCLQVGPLLLMYTPGLTNLMARFTEYNTLWRLKWLTLPGFTLAYVGYTYRNTFWNSLTSIREWFRCLRPTVQMPLAIAGSALLVAIYAGFIVAPILAFERDIIGRSARQWIPSPGLHAVLVQTADAATAMGAPLVLASATEIYQIALDWPTARALVQRGVRGTLPHYPPDRQEEAIRHLQLVNTLGERRADQPAFRQELQNAGYNLIIVNRADMPALAESLDRFPFAYMPAFESDSHSIYLVVKEKDSLMTAIGEAQLLLAAGEKDAACQLFSLSLDRWPRSVFALAGAGLCAELRGDTDAALRHYNEAMTDGDWTLPPPADYTSWSKSFPRLYGDMADSIREWTRDFLSERIYHCYMAISPGQVLVSGSIWKGGWPRQSLIQLSGTIVALDIAGMRTGDVLQIHYSVERELVTTSPMENAKVEQQQEEAMLAAGSLALTILWDTPNGQALVGSTFAEAGTDGTLYLSSPPGAWDRLWLIAGPALDTTTPKRVTWYGWRALMPEERRAIPPDHRQFSEWIAHQMAGTGHTGTRPKAGHYLGVAEAILSETDGFLKMYLTSHNLVADGEWNDPLAAGWRPTTTSSKVRFAVTPRDPSGTQQGAEVHSATEGYHGGWCQSIPVQPRQAYVYVAEIEAVLQEGGKASLLYWDYRRLGRYLSFTSQILKVSAGPRYYWTLIRPPAGVRNISICPALLTNAGTLRFDNVWVLPLDTFH